MTITAWRIFKRKHAAAAFSGEGARRYGGRWNSKGTPMIYTAASASLAVLEMLVHLESREVLDAYLLADVTFDDALVLDVAVRRLPTTWRADPPPRELKQIGDRWAASLESVVLRVPSSVVETESNYLINPAHPDFPRIVLGKPKPFVFDRRLAR